MGDVTPFIAAMIVIMAIVAAWRNKLPRWARFTLIASEAVLIFFAIVYAVFG